MIALASYSEDNPRFGADKMLLFLMAEHWTLNTEFITHLRLGSRIAEYNFKTTVKKWRNKDSDNNYNNNNSA